MADNVQAGKTLLLPVPFSRSSSSAKLIAQGAESLLYKIDYLTKNNPAALKFRPSKAWRHPILDQRLTRHRILGEAKILNKLRNEGLDVPAVLGLNWHGIATKTPSTRQGAEAHGGWMVMEWIEGMTVRKALDFWRDQEGSGAPRHASTELINLLRRIGVVIGKLHQNAVIHGDLTTSNLMLRPASESSSSSAFKTCLEGDVVLVDFGLATQSYQDEDRAVDLYVLERAFGSTHPDLEKMFSRVLEAYGTSFKGADRVLRRLEDVQQRGRKKSMLG